LTNNFDSIKIEKGDRRFIANKVSKEHKGDTPYFINLYNEIKSKKYDRACYDFFMTRIIKTKSFQDERPITSYYSDLQERNIPTTAQFLIDIMHNEKNGEYKATATEFYSRFCMFLKENGFEYKINSTKFGLEMKQYSVIKKVDTNKCRLYKINIKELEEYLLKEKLYKPAQENNECLFNPEKYIDPKDKAVYVRVEEYKNVIDKQNTTELMIVMRAIFLELSQKTRKTYFLRLLPFKNQNIIRIVYYIDSKFDLINFQA
jgi:hypothetical protein